MRTISATDLAIEPEVQIPTPTPYLGAPLPQLPPDHPLVVRVKELLTHYGGVILTGPPGTSKSFCAAAIANVLVDGDPTRLRLVQFHPSYQYEDFVEGYVPDSGSFTLRPKHLLEMCLIAARDRTRLCVIVIDELSRADPGRVFGEALTYLEATKRNISFSLASGTTVAIPTNLVFIATMNPIDRGVDEVDLAFERRFAKVSMDPDAAILDHILIRNGVEGQLRQRIGRFFRWMILQPNEYARIGHAYFNTVRDEQSLRLLWEHQLRFLVQKAYRLDNEGAAQFLDKWNLILQEEGSIPRTPASGAQPPEGRTPAGVAGGPETGEPPIEAR